MLILSPSAKCDMYNADLRHREITARQIKARHRLSHDTSKDTTVHSIVVALKVAFVL